MKNKNRILNVFSLALAFFFFSAGAAFAERVTAVEAENTFVLDSGQRVRLAGLVIPDESRMLISVLLAGKDIQVRNEKALVDPLDPTLPLPSYFYIDTAELDFPFADETHHQQKKKVGVSELILALGGAYVDESKSFEMKEDFLKIQAEAKAAGKGIWSYEEHATSPNV